MYQLLVQVCRWIQSTRLALGILESTWAFPYVQLTHFTGLSLWVGTNLLLDLRLLGVGKNRSTAAQLCEALFVWNWTGFCIAITGGFMLFSTAALTYVANPAFEMKLGFLIPFGVLLHIFIQRRTPEWGKTAETPGVAKLAGFLELSVWLSVISAAVLIPYLGAEP